jgi:rod shape-determining protein MreC
MPEFLRRASAPIAFGALILLATVSMVTDRNALRAIDGRDLPWWQGLLLEIAIPVQNAVAAPVDAARNAWQGYVDLLDIREENSQLREALSRLEEENLQYREALVASGHLERIAAMRDDFGAPMLPSEIVGVDVSPWFRSVLVDRGADHGVRSGNPVITDAGVVGLVTRTSPHAAKTMLLLDRQSTIDSVIQRSRTRGIIHGRGIDLPQLEFEVRGSDVQVGDILITSGLGGVYPKGLRLGEVVTLDDPGGSLMQIATIEPSVDFATLEQVFIMLRRGPIMDLLYGSNTPEGLEHPPAAVEVDEVSEPGPATQTSVETAEARELPPAAAPPAT